MTTVLAYLNHGRWVADCPNCKNAEVVRPDTPFICTAEHPLVRRGKGEQRAQATLQAIASRQAYTVIFPEDRALIESLVRKRPEQNRNWQPGERIKDLVAENLDHRIKQDGLGVDRLVDEIVTERLAKIQAEGETS